MKINYKKGNLKFHLILGLLFLSLSIIKFLNLDSDRENNWADYIFSIIPLLYFTLYFYQRLNQYLIIKDGVLILNDTFFCKKKVKLTEIQQIKKFAGDYILKTDKKKFTINTQVIEPESLVKLNTELEKLNVEWI